MNPVAATNMTPRHYFLDFEVDSVPKASGDPAMCITQLAVIDPSREKGQRVFESYIKPPRLLRKKEEAAAMEQFKHGYTAPPRRSFKKVWPQLVKWVNQGLDGNRFAVFVAHNAYKHDWPLLKQECERIGEVVPGHWKEFCSLYLSSALKVPGGHSLQELVQHFQVKYREPAHDAYNDARMLRDVFMKMIGSADLGEVLRAIPNESNPVKRVVQLIQGSAASVPSSLSSSSSAVSTAMKVDRQAVVVFFDFETTGLYPKAGQKGAIPRVVEVAGYIPSLKAEFQSLVNPGCKIPIEAQNVHHISNEKVKDAPDFKTAWTKFEAWMHDRVKPTADKVIVLAGHNIYGYDLKLLRDESARVGLPSKFWKAADTLALSRHLFRGNQGISHKMQELRKRFGIAANNAHRALDDVIINAQIFDIFTQGVPQKMISEAVLSDHPILKLGAAIREYGAFDASKHLTMPAEKKGWDESDDDDVPVQKRTKKPEFKCIGGGEESEDEQPIYRRLVKKSALSSSSSAAAAAVVVDDDSDIDG